MCSYIDMPLQHISDPILQRMKRATTRKKTLALLQRLRQRLPGVGLRSSFIVGFPGETEAQFEELLDFVEETRFDHVIGFVYSPEEGTAAYELDGEVPEEVAEERYSRLSQLQERVSAQLNDELIGTRQVVLVDEEDGEGSYFGRMERDAPEIDGQVQITRGEARVGKFVEVEVTGAYAYELSGRAVGVPY
jgi:ribosomal protein S12 methylthiotransferase